MGKSYSEYDDCPVFQRYEVTLSMMEIYNEQVRDLLTKDFPKGGKETDFVRR